MYNWIPLYNFFVPKNYFKGYCTKNEIININIYQYTSLYAATIFICSIFCQNNPFTNSNSTVVVDDMPGLPHIFYHLSIELYHLTRMEEGFSRHDPFLEVL